ncbi:MAG: helix-turn-helix domain-containing protein, partial [Acidobacteria bacterium]|nr:helix-turn-helix domain-containing protein [Acidobacteriota bacterium]
MEWFEMGALDDLGFSIYEKKALATLASLGVADAATLCREGDIPTSKIYRAMEKLSSLGVVEIQPTRPKLYAMVEVEVA